jgi:hypothetical protein
LLAALAAAVGFKRVNEGINDGPIAEFDIVWADVNV